MNKSTVDELTKFRNRLKNSDFTLISRDCVGGVLYHQLGLKFLSPTINLFFTPEDFNYFCLYLHDYLNGELEEKVDENIPYPVGLLHPTKDSKINRVIELGFMHYETFIVAKQKWEERKARINFDNIFVVSTFCYPKEVETISEDLVKKWNKIKYKKVMLVDKSYGFDNEFIIEQPKECEEYAWLLFEPDQENPWKRTFNEFDFIKFLNRRRKTHQ